jgi:hypothetical protein
MKNDVPSTCGWSPELFNELRQLSAKQFSEEDYRLRPAMERIDNLDPTNALIGEDKMAKAWEDRARPATENDYERLSGIWRDTGCAAEGTPYVIGGLLFQLQMGVSPLGAQSRQLAAAFLDEEHCPGARSLSAPTRHGSKKSATDLRRLRRSSNNTKLRYS